MFKLYTNSMKEVLLNFLFELYKSSVWHHWKPAVSLAHTYWPWALSHYSWIFKSQFINERADSLVFEGIWNWKSCYDNVTLLIDLSSFNGEISSSKSVKEPIGKVTYSWEQENFRFMVSKGMPNWQWGSDNEFLDAKSRF